MYICLECGETFEKPKEYVEHYPYGMGYVLEIFTFCPYCESESFKEAMICPKCYEYVEELTDGLCVACHGEVYGKEEEE